MWARPYPKHRMSASAGEGSGNTRGVSDTGDTISEVSMLGVCLRCRHPRALEKLRPAFTRSRLGIDIGPANVLDEEYRSSMCGSRYRDEAARRRRRASSRTDAAARSGSIMRITRGRHSGCELNIPTHFGPSERTRILSE